MRPSEGTLIRGAAAVGLVAMLATGGAVGLEPDGANDCVVVSVQTLEHGIEVAVVNRGADPHAGTVRVLAVLEGGELAECEARFDAGAGQTVFIPLAAPGPIRGIIDAGVILDDGPPFNF